MGYNSYSPDKYELGDRRAFFVSEPLTGGVYWDDSSSGTNKTYYCSPLRIHPDDWCHFAVEDDSTKELSIGIHIFEVMALYDDGDRRQYLWKLANTNQGEKS